MSLSLLRSWALIGVSLTLGGCCSSDAEVEALRFQSRGELEAAIASARTAVSDCPENGEYHALLARLLLENGQPHDAQGPALAALRRESGNLDWLILAATILNQSGEPERARQFADDALEQGQNPHAHLQAGIASIGLNDQENARAHLRLAENELTINNDEVRGAWDRFRAKWPDASVAHGRLGDIYVKEKVTRGDVAVALVGAAEVPKFMQRRWQDQERLNVYVVPPEARREWRDAAAALTPEETDAEGMAIKECVAAGLLKAPGGQPRPDDSVDRAEMSRIVLQIVKTVHGGPPPQRGTAPGVMRDIGVNDPNRDAIVVAASIGAVVADGNLMFRPDAPMTGADLRRAIGALEGEIRRVGAMPTRTAEPADPEPGELPPLRESPLAGLQQPTAAGAGGYVASGIGVGAQPDAERQATVRAVEEVLQFMYRNNGQVGAEIDARLAELAAKAVAGGVAGVRVGDPKVEYDLASELAVATVSVEIDRQQFGSEGEGRLRVLVRGDNDRPGTAKLVQAVREGLSAAGFFLIDADTRLDPDILVQCDGSLTESPGRGGFNVYDGALEVRVIRPDSREVVAETSRAGESQVSKTEANALNLMFTDEQFAGLAPWVAQSIVSRKAHTTWRHLFLQGLPGLYAVEDLRRDLLGHVNAETSTVREVEIVRQTRSTVHLRLAIDPRANDRLRGLIDGTPLPNGSRIVIDHAAGATLAGHVEN